MTENNRKTLKKLTVTLTLAILALFLLNMAMSDLVKAKQQRETAALTYFKDFSLNTFDRATGTAGTESFTSGDLGAYKVIVFNGWGPWCSACISEMPILNELFEEFKEKGLLIVGVEPQYESSSPTDGDAEIARVLEAYDIRFPILLGDERFAAEVVPTMAGLYPGTWAVDSDGRVLGFVSGSLDADGWRAQFKKWLKEAR